MNIEFNKRTPCTYFYPFELNLVRVCIVLNHPYNFYVIYLVTADSTSYFTVQSECIFAITAPFFSHQLIYLCVCISLTYISQLKPFQDYAFVQEQCHSTRLFNLFYHRHRNQTFVLVFIKFLESSEPQ